MDDDFEVFARAVELAWKVNQRPLTPSGKARGRSRWEPQERAQLEELAKELKTARSWGVR